MTFYKQIGVPDVPGFLTALRTQLALEGWTIHQIQSDPSIPADRKLGEEFLAQSNGLGAGFGDPAHHVVGINTVDVFGGGGLAISFWCAAGMRGPVDLTQVSYSGAVATCETAAPHPFRDGDLVFFNGVSDPAANQCNADPGNIAKATLIGSPGVSVAWTQNMVLAGPAGPSAGGKAYAVYNIAGGRTEDGARSSNLFLANAPMDLYLYTDPFFFWGIVVQGGAYYWFFAGRPGREHVQAEASGAAKIANGSPIVSDGIAASVIDLDRSIAGKLYVGAKIQCYNPSDATPETIDISRTRVDPFTVTSVNSGTQIEAVLPSGTWQPGAIVGMDAAVCIAGTSRVGNSSLDSLPLWATFAMNGESASYNDNQMAIRVRTSTNEEQDNDPDGKNEYRGNECVLADFRGARLFVPGLLAVTRGVQNDADIMKGGDPANSPVNDYIVFPSLDVQGHAPALGDGAS